jgi:hypothetical protein
MTEFQTSRQAVIDALALRGPDEHGGGFMVTSDPAEYLTGQRLRLAREALRLLPAGATMDDADRIAEKIAPRIESMLRRPWR